MYKPIQIAEVLRHHRLGEITDLSDIESFRNRSIHWRNDVTTELMGKVSTSSARFQHDVWNESAMKSEYLVQLGAANLQDASIEKMIYRAISKKQEILIDFFFKLENVSTASGLKKLFSLFDSDNLQTSRDRLFEILISSTFEALMEENEIFLSIRGLNSTSNSFALAAVSKLVGSREIRLKMSRLGRTNSADAGVDVWSNFGVIVNIKHRLVDEQLLSTILEDTPNGELLIVCKAVTSKALSVTWDPTNQRAVSILTLDQVWSSVEDLELEQLNWDNFMSNFIQAFRREFPLVSSLVEFMNSRNYLD